ncbi:MAG: cell division protein FtsQ/DivIB [Haliea sp.]|nr:cell division protein FtsQ/DivIB [Haliea sp.]
MAEPRKATALRRRTGAGATRRQPQREPRSAARVRPGFGLLSGWVNRMLILLATGVVCVVGLRGWIALEEIPVQRIAVTGTLHRTQTEVVQEMVQPALVGGFLSADLDDVRARLQALPWIYRVNVRRRWPNALEINVQEQLPIARWGQGGFLNHEGEVFQSSNVEEGASLPRLEGPAGSEGQLIVSYQQLGELLQPMGLVLHALSLDGRGYFNAELDSGTQLALGNADFGDRLERFATVYQRELAQRWGDVERVDLRYENGMAVAFREPAVNAEHLAGVPINNPVGE